MASTVSFIQANLQHSISASRVLSRRVSAKGIDMALIQEPRFRKGRFWGLNIPGYTPFSKTGIDLEPVSLRGMGQPESYQDSFVRAW